MGDTAAELNLEEQGYGLDLDACARLSFWQGPCIFEIISALGFITNTGMTKRSIRPKFTITRTAVMIRYEVGLTSETSLVVGSKNDSWLKPTLRSANAHLSAQ